MSFFDAWRARRFQKKFKKVGPGCRFDCDYLEIKGHVELGARCVVENNVLLRTHGQGRILVGDEVELGVHVMIASNDRVEISAGTHRGPTRCCGTHHLSRHGCALAPTPHQTAPIIIGKNCYIGPHLYPTWRDHRRRRGYPSAKHGEKDVGPNEIWAGRPVAQCIGRRDGGGPGPP